MWAEPLHPPLKSVPADGETRVQTWLEAVRDGIAEEMRRDRNIIYMGEGTGERGGSFAHTKGLWHEFGPQRMIDTPICELGFTGAAAGAAASGCRAVADVMFADFMFEAASQLIEQAAKLRYMSNGQTSVPMIVRAAWGTIKNTGPHHSGSYHPIWAHCPGLIVVIPSNPADAKGLFKTALQASDPVIFLEPKAAVFLQGPGACRGALRAVRRGQHRSPGNRSHDRLVRVARAPLPGGGRADGGKKASRARSSTCGRSFRWMSRRLSRALARRGACWSSTKGLPCAAWVRKSRPWRWNMPSRVCTRRGPAAHRSGRTSVQSAHENAVVVSVERILSAAKAVLAGQPEIPRRLVGIEGPPAREHIAVSITSREDRTDRGQ